MKRRNVKKQIMFTTLISLLSIMTIGFSVFISSVPLDVNANINVSVGEINVAKWFTIEIESIFDICPDGFVKNEEIVNKGYITLNITLDNEKAKNTSFVKQDGNINIITLLNYKSNAAILDSKILNEIYYVENSNIVDLIPTSEFTTEGLKNTLVLNVLNDTQTSFKITYGFEGNIYQDLIRNTVQFNFMVGVE